MAQADSLALWYQCVTDRIFNQHIFYIRSFGLLLLAVCTVLFDKAFEKVPSDIEKNGKDEKANRTHLYFPQPFGLPALLTRTHNPIIASVKEMSNSICSIKEKTNSVEITY